MSDDTHAPKEPPNQASEPRAGDLVSGRASTDDLDPETIAQLAAWFGAPAAEVTPQQPTKEQPQDREMRELWERRRRAMDAVDPSLVAKLDAKRESGEGFIRLPEPPTLNLERPLDTLDMSVWKLHLSDIRDYERPEDIRDLLAENTPQSLLRDLHRPVLNWPKYLKPEDTGVDVGGQAALTEVHRIVTTRYQVRMGEHPLASHQIGEHMADLRARLDEPWEAVEIPEERRTSSSEALSAADMLWFSEVGYDPTI